LFERWNEPFSTSRAWESPRIGTLVSFERTRAARLRERAVALRFDAAVLRGESEFIKRLVRVNRRLVLDEKRRRTT
jgi:hypothetical protein